MRRELYERNLPPTVRVKIVRVEDEAAEAELRDAPEPLLKALEAADEAYERRWRQIRENYGLDRESAEEFVWTNPEPAAVQLPKSQLQRLLTILGEKSRKIYEKPIKIRHQGKTYLLSIEYPCG